MNVRAKRLADHVASNAEDLRVAVHHVASGARIMDCGIKIDGGLQAGLFLARACLGGLGEVSLTPGGIADLPLPTVQVSTDAPVAACMAAQYAGWQISLGKFFAMGSGPMRALARVEELYDHLDVAEVADVAVGVLETRKLPDDDVATYVAEKARVRPEKLTLLAAPAASIAGTLQVVARSVETALHKLHLLHFDLRQIVAGFGSAPLPPVAKDEVRAIGRTNDAILYGGQATLWVRADDDALAELGAKVPSSSSPDHGAPFAETFARCGGDFYKMDPMLFSPAMITFCNLATGRAHRFGRLEPAILHRSFFDE